MNGVCVIWAHHRNRAGYGKRRVGEKIVLAHRYAYEEAYGPIPDGMTVDHLCFTPACVNPEHLRLLTLSENAQNQRSAFKTHCDNGHEFTPGNTYIRPRKYRGGKRDCRTCIRERVARYKSRRTAA